ncbi:MAG: hypothetical protein RLZZ337_922 [Bacteroidota bacterium]|jgi:RNA polymerase sigma-70 factor (ECF subfamily)
MTETEIIAKCKKQDRRAQNELYKRYFPLMSSLALRYTQNEEDAISRMNMGFLKVLQNIESYNSNYALATWIRNVLVNHFIDEFRKEKHYITTMQLTMDEEPLYDVDWNEGEQKLDAEALFDLLKSLPAMTDKVFNLYAIDGFKHKEIAEMLSISEGTSKWHVSDARKRLKLALDEAEIKDTRKLELNIKLK